MEAIALRLEAIALRLEAIALIRLEAIASRLEAIALRLEAIALFRLEGIASRLEVSSSQHLEAWMSKTLSFSRATGFRAAVHADGSPRVVFNLAIAWSGLFLSWQADHGSLVEQNKTQALGMGSGSVWQDFFVGSVNSRRGFLSWFMVST